MLTRTGWTVLAAGSLQLFAGRVVGPGELMTTGVVTISLTAMGLALVWLTSLRLDVTREISPEKVHAGTASTVTLHIRNLGGRVTPSISVRDHVSGTRGIRMMLAPIRPGTDSTVTYSLPTERRGILEVGPLFFGLEDPFGLARATLRVGSVAELTVFPRIHSVAPIPRTTGNDPHAGAEHPNALGRSGEDFYALRQYVVGDDMRRVHWPSTARHDELMVRQDEVPWQSRATILIDNRSTGGTEDSFELMVSAAASLVRACAKRQDLVRLVTADPSDSGFATGHAGFNAMMEHLATLERTRARDLTAAAALLASGSFGGALVVLVGDNAQRRLLDPLSTIRTRFGSVIVVQVDASAAGLPAHVADLVYPGALQVTSTRAFPEVWNVAFSGRSRRLEIPA